MLLLELISDSVGTNWRSALGSVKRGARLRGIWLSLPLTRSAANRP